jgi:hypothetical protein
MLSGHVYRQQMWAPAIGVIGGGVLPTPKAGDGERGRDKARARPDTKGRELATVVRDHMLPTPKANDAKKGAHFDKSCQRNGLPAAVAMLPTPTTRAHKDGSQPACANTPANGLLGREIHHAAGSTLTGAATYLNPSFVEEMMGFPVGWTV